jgi:hypothetical protein
MVAKVSGRTRAIAGLTAERRAKMLRLYSRGARPTEILAAMPQDFKGDPSGYSSIAQVSADLKRVLENRDAQLNEEAAKYKAMMMAQYDEMRREAWAVLERKHYVVNQGVVVYLRGDGVPEESKGAGFRPRVIASLEAEIAEVEARMSRGDTPLQDDQPVLDALKILLKIADQVENLMGWKAPIKKQVEVQAGADLGTRFAAALGQLAGGGPPEDAAPDRDGGEPEEVPEAG